MDNYATSTTDPSSPTDSTSEEELAQTCTTPLPQNDQRQPDVETLGEHEPSQEPESETQPDVSLLTPPSASFDIIPSTTPKAEREKTEAIRPKTQRRWIKKPGGWFWELVTWLFGTLSILAIVLVLALFNHKNVEQWKSSIRINTIVSVLSQVAVSALMVSVSAGVGQMKWVWYQAERSLIDIDRFDVASRGPQGSVIFLCGKRRVL